MEFSRLPPNREIGNYVYNTQAFLGQGAYGQVYLGHPRTQPTQNVAIKKMDLNKLTDPELQKSLDNELTILRLLGGPHNCGLLDEFQSTRNQYIIQPLCNGGDMRAYLTKIEKLPESQALLILQQCLKGLKELYINDIAHRDLKPENILINNNTFLIADYGFSTFTNGQQMTTKLGTPLYMSPQVHLCQPYSMKNDIWAIGMIYYEMLCGRTPWPINCERDLYEMPRRIPIRFPAGVQISRLSQNFIRGCLQFHEKDRLSWDQIFQSQIFLSPFQTTKQKRPRKTNSQVVQLIMQIQDQLEQNQISSQEIFQRFDKGQNRLLDINEFANLVQSLDNRIGVDLIQQLYMQIAGQDNMVDFDEFDRLVHTDHEDIAASNYLIHEMRCKNVIKYLTNQIYQRVLSIQDIIARFDTNRDSRLQIEELWQLVKYYDRNVTATEVEYLFDTIDKNRNGYIDLNEFIDFFDMELTDRGYQMIQPDIYMIADRNFLVEIVRRNHIDLRVYLRHFDMDRNLQLDFGEFIQFMQRIEARNIGLERLKGIFSDLSQGAVTIPFQNILAICGQ